MAVVSDIRGYRCDRCKYEWLPRKETIESQEPPKSCPRCKSPYWNSGPPGYKSPRKGRPRRRANVPE